MQLTFLGTRGEIPLCSYEHRRHSALLIETGNARIMIDCGTDWLDALDPIAPDVILLTHAHADHAAGLAQGAPCPVYATQETISRLSRFPVNDWRLLEHRHAVKLGKARFEAFPLQHSINAPAVGFRVSEAGQHVFYSPTSLPSAIRRMRSSASPSISATAPPRNAPCCASAAPC